MDSEENREKKTIQMPARTFWPMILAFGITLLGAGLVTTTAVSLVGFLLLFFAMVGWWHELLPVDKHEEVPLLPGLPGIKASPRTVIQLKPGEGGHRVRIPAEIHPYSSGIKGGFVGAVAMAIVACAYGLIFHGSIWYPINLLAAAALPSMANANLAQLKAFDATAFAIAFFSHGILSILVGVVYAVLLPMLPLRYAPYYCSFVAPFFWTALVWASLDLINPTLNARIAWPWFIASQVAFGATCGYVVARSSKIETMQTWPLAARAGLEAPGIMHEREDE